MRFVKAEGLGNDFIVVAEPLRAAPDRIAAWCERKTGIGADGVLEVIPIDGVVGFDALLERRRGSRRDVR